MTKLVRMSKPGPRRADVTGSSPVFYLYKGMFVTWIIMRYIYKSYSNLKTFIFNLFKYLLIQRLTLDLFGWDFLFISIIITLDFSLNLQ